jgi:hypothetical protein
MEVGGARDISGPVIFFDMDKGAPSICRQEQGRGHY